MHRALMQQGALLGQQQEEITTSHHALTEISLQLNQLSEWLDQLHTCPPAAQVVTPPPDGTSVRCAELSHSVLLPLTQVSLTRHSFLS